MKIKTHPKHIDFSTENLNSTYSQTLDRFSEILNNRIGIKNKQNLVNNNSNLSFQNVNKALYTKKFSSEEISNDLSLISYDAESKIDDFLENSPMNGLGKKFVDAQNKYGINAYFLSSLASLESAKGSSQIARDKSNLFGFRAYDNNPYESAMSFENFEDSIEHVAKYLSNQYLSEEGKYHRGKTIKDFNENYATDKNWHNKIKDIMKDMIGN